MTMNFQRGYGSAEKFCQSGHHRIQIQRLTCRVTSQPFRLPVSTSRFDFPGGRALCGRRTNSRECSGNLYESGVNSEGHVIKYWHSCRHPWRKLCHHAFLRPRNVCALWLMRDAECQTANQLSRLRTPAAVMSTSQLRPLMYLRTKKRSISGTATATNGRM